MTRAGWAHEEDKISQSTAHGPCKVIDFEFCFKKSPNLYSKAKPHGCCIWKSRPQRDGSPSEVSWKIGNNKCGFVFITRFEFDMINFEQFWRKKHRLYFTPQNKSARSFIKYPWVQWFAWQRLKSSHQRAGQHQSRSQRADSMLVCCYRWDRHNSVSFTVVTIADFHTNASALAVEQSPLSRQPLPACCRLNHDTGQIETCCPPRGLHWLEFWAINLTEKEANGDSRGTGEWL